MEGQTMYSTTLMTMTSSHDFVSTIRPVIDINRPATTHPANLISSSLSVSTSDTNSTVYSTNVTEESHFLDDPTFIGLSTFLAFITLLSLIGNSMILLTMILFKHMRTKTNIFIANLAFADLCVTVLCMPFSLTTVIKGKWVFGMEMCNLNAFFDTLCLVASIHSLMYIGIHKFFSLVKPLSRIVTHRRMWVMIALAWLTALSCAIGPMVGWSENDFKTGTTQCGPKYPESLEEKSHAYFVLIVGYLIPIVVIIVLYSCIFRTIKQYSHRLRLHSSMDIQDIFRQQIRIIGTLFLLVLSFVFLWTPYFVYVVMGLSMGFENVPVWLHVTAYWCGYTNSAINPIIYAWRAKSFRNAIKDLCCCVTNNNDYKFGSSKRLAAAAWTTSRFQQSPNKSAKPLGSNLSKKKSISLQSLSNVNKLIFPYVTPDAVTENIKTATLKRGSKKSLYKRGEQHQPYVDKHGSMWSLAVGSYTSEETLDGDVGNGGGGGNAAAVKMRRGQSLFELAVLAHEEERMQTSQTSLNSSWRADRCLSEGAKTDLEMEYYDIEIEKPIVHMTSFRSYQGSTFQTHLSPQSETAPEIETDPALQVYGTFAMDI